MKARLGSRVAAHLLFATCRAQRDVRSPAADDIRRELPRFHESRARRAQPRDFRERVCPPPAVQTCVARVPCLSGRLRRRRGLRSRENPAARALQGGGPSSLLSARSREEARLPCCRRKPGGSRRPSRRWAHLLAARLEVGEQQVAGEGPGRHLPFCWRGCSALIAPAWLATSETGEADHGQSCCDLVARSDHDPRPMPMVSGGTIGWSAQS